MFVVTWNSIQYIQIFLDFMGPKTAQNISIKDLPDLNRTGRLQCLSWTEPQNILDLKILQVVSQSNLPRKVGTISNWDQVALDFV